MNGRCIALAASRCGEPRLATDSEHLDREALASERARDDIQPDAVAPDCDEVGDVKLTRDEGDLDFGVGVDDLGVARYPNEAVCPTERSDGTAALPHRIRGQAAVRSPHETDQQILETAALRRNLVRQERGHALSMSGCQPGELANHGRHELVESEYRGSRKSGKDHHR
jgi:hypothetical protein